MTVWRRKDVNQCISASAIRATEKEWWLDLKISTKTRNENPILYIHNDACRRHTSFYLSYSSLGRAGKLEQQWLFPADISPSNCYYARYIRNIILNTLLYFVESLKLNLDVTVIHRNLSHIIRYTPSNLHTDLCVLFRFTYTCILVYDGFAWFVYWYMFALLHQQKITYHILHVSERAHVTKAVEYTNPILLNSLDNGMRRLCFIYRIYIHLY